MSGTWAQELSCLLPCTWLLTVQNAEKERGKEACGPGTPICFLPWAPRINSPAWGCSDFSQVCPVPCPSVSLLLGVILSPPLGTTLSPSLLSLCPCPPLTPSLPLLPLCPGCRCSRPAPLHFWSQPKPSWPWRDGNAPRKVGTLLGAVLERRGPGALRCIHGSTFSFSLCSLAMCVFLSLLPEDIYGNWSLPLNTSHIWHPRIREVGLHLG